MRMSGWYCGASPPQADMVARMASFPCPYCAHDVATEAQDDRLERCPSCSGSLQIAYRYRIVAASGKSPGGVLYEAVDDIFADKVGVLFVENMNDRAAVERFVEGHRLFTELGGGRGLIKLRELGNLHERRPYVVHDWLTDGTLEQQVRARGPVDQATLLELIGDLLVGLSRAHRAMPTVVHGQIHPGKIGFLAKHRVVLFGFEWAQKVYEQDSSLADTFVTQAEVKSGASRANDLRQLGISVHYAATGEWNADKSLEYQRGRVRELGGPLPLVIDRMLTAGGEGYRSAVDALQDFEHLLEGTSTWKVRLRPREQDRSNDLIASAWTSVNQAAAPGHRDDDHGHGHDHDDDDDHDHDHEDVSDFLESADDGFDSARPTPSASQFPSAAHVARRQLHAAQAAAASSSKPATPSAGKVVFAIIGAMVVFGMCVGVIAEDQEAAKSVPVQVVMPRVEPIPPPPYELPAEPGFATPEPDENSFVDVQHHTGTIVGPPEVSGFELGERCDVWIAPNVGGLNCKWYIDCGEPRKRIYGGGDVGYSNCTIENGRPTGASDDEQDAPDGSFVALMSGTDPMVLVEDRWLQPPTSVLISLEADGGSYSGAVPDVALARRMSRDEIESAIARNKLPEFDDKAKELPETLSPQQIRKILDGRTDMLRACGTADMGPLKIKLSLGSEGHISEVQISPTVDSDTELCLISVLTGTRFPSFSGPPVSLTWPMRF
jgi:hypothetical protein